MNFANFVKETKETPRVQEFCPGAKWGPVSGARP